VTTLASFFVGPPRGTPVIRTADADRIKGVPDQPVAARSTTPATGAAGSHPTGWSPPDSALVAAGAALVVGVGAVLMLRRRRRQ
jgi:LPXTG-motif cell wall-anchored protein